MKNILPGLALACLLLSALAAPAANAADSAPARSFPTPVAAADALFNALKTNNFDEVLVLLGASAPGQDTEAVRGLIESDNPDLDASDRAAFLAAYEAKHVLSPYGERYMLEVGQDGWPFPFPLTRGEDGHWSFDPVAGKAEMEARLIGRNEIAAMNACLTFVEAQNEYYRLNPENAPVRHFAAAIASEPGKRNGLYWTTAEGEEPSPLGALAASADVGQQRYGKPFHGYRYRVLTGQGPSAPGGAASYLKDGLLTEGFAFIAYPDEYGVSGVMTFLVGQDGTMYEANLGRRTAQIAQTMTRFNPDSAWRKTEKPE